jgi:hypothetical protein
MGFINGSLTVDQSGIAATKPVKRLGMVLKYFNYTIGRVTVINLRRGRVANFFPCSFVVYLSKRGLKSTEYLVVRRRRDGIAD